MRTADSSRSFQTLLGGAAALIVVILLIAGVRSYHDLVAVKTREARIERQIEKTDERTGELQSEIELLRHDPATLERLAREELGLVKPGDLVMLLSSDENVEASIAERTRTENE